MFYFILYYAIHTFLLFYHFTLDYIRCACQLIIKRTCTYVCRGVHPMGKRSATLLRN